MEDCRKLMEFIPRERDWVSKEQAEKGRSPFEERKLELRLGPPGDQWSSTPNETGFLDKESGRGESFLSAGYCFNGHHPAEWLNNQLKKDVYSPFTAPHRISNKGELIQPRNCAAPSDLQLHNSSSERKGFSVPSSVADGKTNTSHLSQKRTAPGPVVGWPPIRSFRKNLAGSSSSKRDVSETENIESSKSITTERSVEINRRRMFTKVNMDGIPIGRKVDLSAYDDYQTLASAVDELFKGLLAAQNESSPSGNTDNVQEEVSITGLLDGSGEYTLVYEDIEGDRMLVGDVPWNMFVSTVKRLRVLKSSDVSSLSRGRRTMGPH